MFWISYRQLKQYFLEMTNTFNTANQISLFSRESMLISEGYRSLAQFRFDVAKRFFKEAVEAGSNSKDYEEATRALKLCSHWQPIILQNHSEPSLFGDETTLYREFREYDFSSSSGEQQFRNSLLLMITNQMLETGRFYTVDDSETVADLLCELGRHQKAEEVLQEQMKIHPEDHYLFYCLAQIQWQNNKKGEAKKRYAFGLLHNPCKVPHTRILHPDLNKLIREVGPEMAPSYGWVRGVLPLVPPRDVGSLCSTNHQDAVECYRLLWHADRAVMKQDIEARVEYRKKLKAHAPELYEEYFALLQGKR